MSIRPLMLKVLLPLSIVVLAIAGFQYLKKTKPQAPPVEIHERAWSVEVMTLTPDDWFPEVVLYGTVETHQRVAYLAPLAAELSELPLKAGQAFKQGDVLYGFNADEIALYLTSAQAELDESKALLHAEKQLQLIERDRLDRERALLGLRQAEFNRNRELQQRSLASESHVDQAREALLRQELVVVNSQLVVDQQQAKLAQLQARLARAQVNFDRALLTNQRARLIAPFDGRVVAVHASKGENLAANSRILEVYPLKSLELRAKLPVIYREKIEQALVLEQPVFAYLNQFGESFALPLHRLAGETAASGIDAFFTLDEALTARPGDLWSVRLQLPRIEQVFAVPYSAVYANKQVYLVEDERLVRRSIELLGETEHQGRKWALIQGDLSSGDQLSVTRLPNAISGLRVACVVPEQGRSEP